MSQSVSQSINVKIRAPSSLKMKTVTEMTRNESYIIRMSSSFSQQYVHKLT